VCVCVCVCALVVVFGCCFGVCVCVCLYVCVSQKIDICTALFSSSASSPLFLATKI